MTQIKKPKKAAKAKPFTDSDAQFVRTVSASASNVEHAYRAEINSAQATPNTVTVTPSNYPPAKPEDLRIYRPPHPLYRAIDERTGKLLGVSVHSFVGALKDADKPYLWAQNALPGATYDGVTLAFDGPVEPPTAVVEGSGSPPADAPPNVTPPVPSTWRDGDRVYRIGLPESTAKPIEPGSINYGSGTLITQVFDDSEGWKTMRVMWDQFTNLDAKIREGR